MAKKEQHDQLNLTVVALVALVAIVGLVALVMNAGSIAGIATGSQLVDAAPTEVDVPILDGEGNVIGMAAAVNCDSLDLKRMYNSRHALLRSVASSCCGGRDVGDCTDI